MLSGTGLKSTLGGSGEKAGGSPPMTVDPEPPADQDGKGVGRGQNWVGRGAQWVWWGCGREWLHQCWLMLDPILQPLHPLSLLGLLIAKLWVQVQSYCRAGGLGKCKGIFSICSGTREKQGLQSKALCILSCVHMDLSEHTLKIPFFPALENFWQEDREFTSYLSGMTCGPFGMVQIGKGQESVPAAFRMKNHHKKLRVSLSLS